MSCKLIFKEKIMFLFLFRSVDFREKSALEGPNVGKDETSSLAQRGKLHVRMSDDFFRKTFRTADNRTKMSSPPSSSFDQSLSAMQTFSSSGGNLEINPVDRSDEGIYKCRVDFLQSPTRNSKVNFTVISKSF